MIFAFFRRARIFEVDFRGRQGGAKVAYIKAFGRFLDFGIDFRMPFWGSRRPFFYKFFGYGWGVVRKNYAFPKAVNKSVLGHLSALYNAFFPNRGLPL